MTKVYAMNGYIEKMGSPDQDFRYMALNDIINDVKQDSSNFVGDENIETKVLQNVLLLIEDKISEVKNQAVKCLGQLIKVVRENQMEIIMDKLIELSGKKDEETRDISYLALKTITAELQQDSRLAPKTCAKLAPKLLSQLRDTSTAPASIIDILSILSILVTRFPNYMSSPDFKPPPIDVLTPLIQHPRPAVQKRAITTVAQFLPPAAPDVFHALLKKTIIPGLDSDETSKQRASVQLIAAVTRYIPQRIAGVLNQIVTKILDLASEEDVELREASLQALEILVFRCPAEIAVYLPKIMSLGLEMIKYDPNYSGDVDGDEDEDMDDVDDESDAELADYSDDEDTSYKIRRSSTKLLAAIIGTRPELLSSLCRDVSPVLISRFGDREDSVKMEVWSTYVLLLNQTAVHAGVSKYSDEGEAPSPLKRKRDSEEPMEVDGSPVAALRSQVQPLSKQLLAQLKGSKVPPAIMQHGFTLLIALLDVLPGSLASQTSQVISITKSVLNQAFSTTTAPLNISALNLLALFFKTHSQGAFAASLPVITPCLLASARQKHPRVSSEAFRAFSALLRALRPLKSSDWANDIYAEAVARLRTSDTDATVRQSSEECLGELWVCAPDVLKTKDGKEWEVILRSTDRTDNPLKVITHVAEEANVSDQWIDGCIHWILAVLKKSGRVGKADAFSCLEVLLSKYKNGIPSALPTSILPLLVPYLGTSDIALLSHSFSVMTVLLQLAPAISYQYIENNLLKEIYKLSLSPLLSGSSLDAMLAFYDALVVADQQIATRIVPSLVLEIEKGVKTTTSPANVAKCLAKVVNADLTIAAGTITGFTNLLKNTDTKELSIVLSLLSLGELGRSISFADQAHIFDLAVGFFNSDTEDIRSAAAFAAGNIAIGDMKIFLPAIVKMVQSDSSKRLLALHALKEVVGNSSNAQLEKFANELWNPLFDNPESSEEASRNVAASCLGKLTTTDPSRYLPQLRHRLKDPSAAVRATVISALRYTLVDSNRSYDELLAPVIVEFLSLMLDKDLTVQRLALSALNSAARNKPHLIRDHLVGLLPQLYAETVMKADLIEVVQMGPWQHKVDKGLDARKAAYETMYTLLDTCLSKIDLHAFLERVLSGLKDDSDEIKVICHMMLFRMAQIAPAATSQRLDDAADPLGTTMRGVAVGKDTVKQDLERASELQKSALRAIAALSKISVPGVAPKFESIVQQTQNGNFSAEFKELTGS